MQKIITFIILSISSVSCSLSDKDIENSVWKLSEIGINHSGNGSIRETQHIDILVFGAGSHYKLSENTIAAGDRVYATIISRKKGNLFTSDKIEIVLTSTKDTLVYAGK
jgi:hypothetical protein